MSELILVHVKQDFYKTGKGENARGFKGDYLELSPALAEFLEERNIVEVVLFDEDDEE